MSVPKSHPRYLSLMIRERIVKGVAQGIASMHGLLAHGRGEAFDYLVGEKTTRKAKQQIRKAAKLLLKAKRPIISVNGNAAALCPKELVQLSKAIPARLEVNIFHPSKSRERKIAACLKRHGAKEVLLPNKGRIKFIASNRRFCSENGIAKAGLVFVPLEDGDRCQALIKMKKKVISIDLNPMSRTAKSATINIQDNIVRAMPLLVKEVKKQKKN
ncbi:phosphopantothenate/pantothenate synthetase [Candidatus Woesearchaeota archaeon]|nr:phosphopantothenate/pantothenate synthetase [Candidatus Woesearchaeota archaeon]